MGRHLQSDVAFPGGLALQGLVPAAAGAPPERDAGGHVDVLHPPGVLLLHVHQLLHGLAHALGPHLLERHDWRDKPRERPPVATRQTSAAVLTFGVALLRGV